MRQSDGFAVEVYADVRFDDEAYSADAIQRAAYRLSDVLSIEIEQSGGSFVCRLYASDPGSTDDLARAFRNEVLDQVLRERIRNETQDLRNAVLALAFSNVDLEPDPSEP